MTLTLIILAYVANVFLNRWLNRMSCKIDNKNPILYYWWFAPIIPTVILPIIICIDLITTSKISNWFTGKHW